jgi:hypothetical protein
MTAHPHFQGIDQWTLGLLFQAGGASIPKLDRRKRSAPDGRRVATFEFALMSRGAGQTIVTILEHDVAAAPGDLVVFGEARFKEEFFNPALSSQESKGYCPGRKPSPGKSPGCRRYPRLAG